MDVSNRCRMGRNRGPEAVRSAAGLPEHGSGGNRAAELSVIAIQRVRATRGPMTGSAKQSIVPQAGTWIASSLTLLAMTIGARKRPPPRLSWDHDGEFPLPEHLCGPARQFFRTRSADPGGLAPADQAQPAAGGPARARPRPARQP